MMLRWQPGVAGRDQPACARPSPPLLSPPTGASPANTASDCSHCPTSPAPSLQLPWSIRSTTAVTRSSLARTGSATCMPPRGAWRARCCAWGAVMAWPLGCCRCSRSPAWCGATGEPLAMGGGGAWFAGMNRLLLYNPEAPPSPRKPLPTTPPPALSPATGQTQRCWPTGGPMHAICGVSCSH